jgi:hypothetical protein
MPLAQTVYDPHHQYAALQKRLMLSSCPLTLSPSTIAKGTDGKENMRIERNMDDIKRNSKQRTFIVDPTSQEPSPHHQGEPTVRRSLTI